MCRGFKCVLIFVSDRKFDLVVMDPPWENKSAKRKKRFHFYFHFSEWASNRKTIFHIISRKYYFWIATFYSLCSTEKNIFLGSYNYLPEHDLKKLPLQKILQRNSLVVVWVTNKQKYLEFVRDVLFPIWGVQCVGHWHWVKVRCVQSLTYSFDVTRLTKKLSLSLENFM